VYVCKFLERLEFPDWLLADGNQALQHNMKRMIWVTSVAEHICRICRFLYAVDHEANHH
jgi:hypothetical protein